MRRGNWKWHFLCGMFFGYYVDVLSHKHLSLSKNFCNFSNVYLWSWFSHRNIATLKVKFAKSADSLDISQTHLFLLSLWLYGYKGYAFVSILEYLFPSVPLLYTKNIFIYIFSISIRTRFLPKELTICVIVSFFCSNLNVFHLHEKHPLHDTVTRKKSLFLKEGKTSYKVSFLVAN